MLVDHIILNPVSLAPCGVICSRDIMLIDMSELKEHFFDIGKRLNMCRESVGLSL